MRGRRSFKAGGGRGGGGLNRKGGGGGGLKRKGGGGGGHINLCAETIKPVFEGDDM